MRICIYIILICIPLLFTSQDISPTIDFHRILKTALHYPDSSLVQLSSFEKLALTESKIINVDLQTLHSIKAFCYYIKGDSIQTASSLQRAFEKPNYKNPLFFHGLFEKTYIKPPKVAAQAKNFIDYFFQSSLQSHNEIRLLTGYMLLQQFLELGENIPEAMRLNFKLLELEEVRRNEFIMIKSRVYSNLGRLTRMLGEYDKALHYHQSAIAFSPDTSDYHIELNINHRANIGNVYRESGNYLEAFKTDSAMLIKRYQIHDTNGIVYQHTSLAISLIYLGKLEKALEELKKAEQFLNPRVRAYQKHKSRIANAWGEYSMRVKKYPQAVDYCITGYEIALDSMRDQRLMRAIENCNCIYSAYEAMNKPIQAYDWYKKSISLRDSLLAKRNRQSLLVAEITRDHKQELFLDSLAQIEKARLVSLRHQEEVQKKNRLRNILLGSGLLLLLMTGGFYSRWRYVRKSRAEIQKEKDRSENLLLNILPAEIAEELKEKGRTDARDYEVVSILFTDFKAFTETSEKLSAADLVSEINACFRAFDEICEKHGIEKIKTIGDAYMAAGGLPIPTDNSIKNTILAALEMQSFIGRRKIEMNAIGKHAFEMRVGIHTGPVVAGIVGVKKFQYDIWGDTVNTANRIESKGEVGKVNISQATYKYIKDDPLFEFESRGKISAKGKGEMEMWFVGLVSEQAGNK